MFLNDFILWLHSKLFPTKNDDDDNNNASLIIENENISECKAASVSLQTNNADNNYANNLDWFSTLSEFLYLPNNNNINQNYKNNRASFPPSTSSLSQILELENYAKRVYSRAKTSYDDSWIVSLKEKLGETAAIGHAYYYDKLRKEEELIDKQIRKQKLKELPYNASQIIQNALKTLNEVILIELFNIPITSKDIQTLNPGAWLNDEIINFYLQLIVKEHSKDSFLIHAFNTFFYSTLKESGYDRVKRWTRKIDIFQKQLLLIPIHLGVHWCLAVIDLNKCELSYYDSLGGKNTECLNILSEYLFKEHYDKKQYILPNSWSKSFPTNIPRQHNGFDCGVFTCVYAEYVSRSQDVNEFSQEMMPYFRKKIAIEILQGKLI